jgi:bacteriocin-like protein
MEKFKELSIEEMQEVNGGISLKKVWDAIKMIWTALEIQEGVNEFVDGWNSVDCDNHHVPL